MSNLTSKMMIFCREYFSGKTARQAAIEAGYAFKSAHVAASRLLRNDNITAHLTELQQQADDDAIMDVVERKKVLSEIGRGRPAQFVDKDGNVTIADSAALQEVRIVRFGDEATTTTVKLHNPVQAIQELNKMERIYGEIGVMVDNRTLNITVVSPEGAEYVRRIATGEGTGKEPLSSGEKEG